MALGNVVKKRREALGLSRYDIERGMEERGFRLAPTTLRNWEKGRKHSETDWDAGFLRALADTLGTTEIDLLKELGFNITIDGYTSEDLEIAHRIRQLSEADRKKMVKMMLAILEGMGIK